MALNDGSARFVTETINVHRLESGRLSEWGDESVSLP